MIKFQSEEYTIDMFEKEYIYFSAQKSFRKQIDKIGRTDPGEGNLAVHNFTSGKFILAEKRIKIDIENAQIVEYLQEDHKLLCSLYCPDLNLENQIINFDTRMLAFGSCAMVIHNVREFFALLYGAMDQAGLEYSSRRATYYDSRTFSGEISVHHKDLSFSYQQEHRIMIWYPDVDSFKLPMPGLKKLVTIVQSIDVPNLRFMLV